MSTSTGAPDQWDARQYLRFADQRLRPFLDLTARVEAALGATTPRLVADLGCGPGNATALLNERWPEARVLGVDSSPAMIATAKELEIPGRLEFDLGDLRDWKGASRDCAAAPEALPDAILMNAVLQWIPDHLAILERLGGLVAPGGVLGMQVPGNFQEPSHTLLAELRHSARWRDLVPADTQRPDSHDPVVYYEALERSGLIPEAWETTYLYIVDGESGVTDFVRGTALRPIVTRLSPADGEAFVADYQALVREAYPPREIGGRIAQVLPYRRIFAVGRRPA